MSQNNGAGSSEFNRSLDYIRQIQQTFDPQSETYHKFLEILREYYDAFKSDVEDIVAKHKAAGATEGADADTAQDSVADQTTINEKRAERTQKALEDVKILFVGHEDLIKGFEGFLPDSEEK